MPALSPKSIVLMTVFIDLMGFSIIIPLVNYLVDDLNGDILHVGLLISSYAFAQFLFLPIWGRLSDRCGRRPVIIFGLAGSTVSFAIFGLADPALGLSSNLTLLFGILLCSRVVQGVSNANLAAAYAYIADITPPEQRARGMGHLGAIFGLGFILGPAIGGTIGQWHIWLAAAFASVLSGVNMVAALRWLPESLPPENRTLKKPPLKEAVRITMGFFRTPVLGLLLGVFALFMLSFSVIFGIYIQFVKDELHGGLMEAGLLFAYMGFVSLVVQGRFVDPLVKRWGELAITRVGLALMVVGIFLTPLSWDIPSIAAITTIFSLGSGMIQPTINSLISRAVGPRQQGAVLGLSQSLGALSRAVGPAMGAVTWILWGYATPFHLASALMFGTLLMALAVRMERSIGINESDPAG